MDFFEVMLKRRSIRKFNDIPIPKQIIADMIAAGITAPIAGNYQNCRVFVVDEEHIKDGIADACFRQTWMKSAPVFMVVISNIDDMEKMYGDRGKNLYAIQNSSAIAQNLILTATSHGLGSCWVSAFNPELVAQQLNLPDKYVPHVVIPIGYSDEIVPKPAKIDMRAFTYINYFGGAGRTNNYDFIFKDYSHFVETHIRKGAKYFRNTIKQISDLIYKKSLPQINKLKQYKKESSDDKIKIPEIKKDNSFKKPKFDS